MRAVRSMLFASLLAAGAVAQAPEYRPERQVAGTLHTWGSTQMGDLLRQYEAGFHAVQPGVVFDDQLRSTITAVAGVYTGRAEIGLLGRALWPVEGQAFASVKGYPPTVLEVATGAYDVPKAAFALMLFVPRANPIAALSTAQLQRIFAAGSPHPVRTWGDLGLRGPWARRPVHRYGFSIENDKSQSFAGLVFAPGQRWTPELHEFAPEKPGEEDAGQRIVRAVAADPDAIGISNVHYALPGVRTVPVAGADGVPVEATRATVESRAYPLTRAVYLVVDRKPDEATREFLRFVYSRQGEEAVRREGNYLPLPAASSKAERAKLGLP